MGLELQALRQRLEADKDIMSSDEVQKLRQKFKPLVLNSNSFSNTYPTLR